jgi:septin family protein
MEGEPVRARVYPWGTVEVDNPHHSDFVRLRSAILGLAIIHASIDRNPHLSLTGRILVI